MTAKGPWKGSRVNIILYINDPMPRIECQKADKSRKLLWKHYVSKQILNHISTKSPKVALRLWVENWIDILHKRTLWIEEPESKFRNKGMKEGSYEKDKSSKAQKVQNGMGMRNKGIFLFTICYNPVVSKLAATWR